MFDPYTFSFVPNNYQPMNPPMEQQMAQFGFQPMQPQQIPTKPAPQNGPGWIMAPTIQAVEQVSVFPGGKSWIMVQNAPVFALRTADQMGLITTEYYKFEKIDPASLASPAAPVEDYVTRQEFQTFVESITAKKAEKGKETPEK